MRNHIVAFIFFSVLACTGIYGQQDAMFTRYMFNSMYLFNNPAYSGTHGHWTTNALYRTQWLSYDGAPQTFNLGAEGLIGKKQNAGLGFSMYHDKIGVDRMTDLSANYAYHIRMGNGQSLSIGIRGGALIYRSLLSQVVVWDPSDPVYSTGDVSGVIPRVGLGVFQYGPNHFIGLSIPTLMAWDNRTTFSVDLDKNGILKRHYYMYGGYVFNLENGIDLKPSVLLKYRPEAPLQADFNLNAWFQNMFSVGASYRTNDAVSVMVEIPIGERFRLGYAFDNTISAIQNFSSGTHEVMIGYNFITEDENPWERVKKLKY